MSEHTVLRTEVFQREMLSLEESFTELGYVYDQLADKIADLKIRLEDEAELQSAEERLQKTEGWYN